MEGSTFTGLGGAPVHGYSRAAIDDFLAQVASERSRLEALIADDEERTRRGRAALGTHRVMVAMLLAAQRELDEIRAEAEQEAAAILAGAGRPQAVLDLTRAEPVPAAAVSYPPALDDPATTSAPRPAESTVESSADYFDFLRGALDDDAPLGPRPEPA